MLGDLKVFAAALEKAKATAAQYPFPQKGEVKLSLSYFLSHKDSCGLETPSVSAETTEE